jgi:hypothetical protein
MQRYPNKVQITMSEKDHFQGAGGRFVHSHEIGRGRYVLFGVDLSRHASPARTRIQIEVLSEFARARQPPHLTVLGCQCLCLSCRCVAHGPAAVPMMIVSTVAPIVC